MFYIMQRKCMSFMWICWTPILAAFDCSCSHILLKRNTGFALKSHWSARWYF
jgi:hypothetical protein